MKSIHLSTVLVALLVICNSVVAVPPSNLPVRAGGEVIAVGVQIVKLDPRIQSIKTVLDLPACRIANHIWDYCTDTVPGVRQSNVIFGPDHHQVNNTETFNCLCSSYLSLWNASVVECTSCITRAFLASPASKSVSPTPGDPRSLHVYLQVGMETYCGSPDEKEMSLALLMGRGQFVSASMQGHIHFYNFTFDKGSAGPDFGGFLPPPPPGLER